MYEVYQDHPKPVSYTHLVQSFFIKPSYYIVKDSVIDYVLSADYDRRKLKARV